MQPRGLGRSHVAGTLFSTAMCPQAPFGIRKGVVGIGRLASLILVGGGQGGDAAGDQGAHLLEQGLVFRGEGSDGVGVDVELADYLCPSLV